jgi:DNA-directed RNA polymerase alpha subunit
MKNQKRCPAGHLFFKSSDSPVCPVCEESRRAADLLFGRLAAPARRALENEGITTLEKLLTYSEKELLKLHGMGKSSLPLLRAMLSEHQLAFNLQS